MSTIGIIDWSIILKFLFPEGVEGERLLEVFLFRILSLVEALALYPYLTSTDVVGAFHINNCHYGYHLDLGIVADTVPFYYFYKDSDWRKASRSGS